MKDGMLRTVFGKEKRANTGYFQFANYAYLLGGAVFTSMSNFAVYVILENTATFPVWLRVLTMIGQILFSAFIIYLAFGFANYNFYVRPMRTIAEAARKVAGGDLSVQIPDDRADGQKDEYAVLVEDFNTMVRELAGMETMRNDFISNVSHELKTPLAVIQSSAMSLRDTTLTEALRMEHREAILSATERLNGLVTNILKLNKLENQEIFPAAEAYQLDEQLRDVILSFEALWDRKELDLDIDLDSVQIVCDASLLEIVWNNLLSNAIKFSNQGGLLHITLRKKSDWVVISVQDSGCGMEPETQAHIFEKFYQGDTSHSGQGNGLGLALVKRVLDIVGGKIAVESVPGEGSVFTVLLPIEK